MVTSKKLNSGSSFIQRLPYAFSIFSILLGVAIAILFGINEDLIKNKIMDGLSKNESIAQIKDINKKNSTIKKEKSKNWRYYQRFHFHSTGIGAISIGVLLLFSFSAAPKFLSLLGSYMVSFGGGLYPFVWLFAGIYGPIMGRGEAKEAFAFFGYMGGVYFIGLAILLYCIIKYPFKFPMEKA